MNADLYFKDTPEGRAFYPYGVVTGGYLVDLEIEATARRFIESWTGGSVLGLFGFIGIAAWLGVGQPFVFFVWAIVALAAYVIGIARITSSCARATARLTRDEFARIQGKSYSSAYMVLLFVSGVLLVLLSIFMLIKSFSNSGTMTLIGAGGCALFGYCLYRLTVIAKARKEPD